MLGRGVEVELSRDVPALVGAGIILFEYEFAVTHDDHGMNVGFGFLQPCGDGAEPRAVEADAFGGGDDPAIVECRGCAANHAGLSPHRCARDQQQHGSEAEVLQFSADLTHATASDFEYYAGGGTEIFTDGRSSMR